MRISDWSSDVCSSDLEAGGRLLAPHRRRRRARRPPGGGDRSPQPAGPALVRALRAQLRTELTLTLRNKESLLLTLGIPVGLLVFFSLVDVLPLDDLLGPGDEPDRKSTRLNSSH